MKVSVSLIFLTVSLLAEDGICVTEDMVNAADKTNELFWRENNQEKFSEAVNLISETATAAFDYWCRVVRWKTGESYVGLPNRRHDAHPGWRYIAAVDPMHHVATYNDTLTAYFHDGISTSMWDEIEATLIAQEQPPIWNEAFHEAKRRLDAGDFRGSVLDMAISVEAFLRSHLLSALAPLPPAEKAIRKRVEKWNMNEVLDNLTKVSTLKCLNIQPNETSILKKIFVDRNSIMHGNLVELEVAVLVEYLHVVKSVVRA